MSSLPLKTVMPQSNCAAEVTVLVVGDPCQLELTKTILLKAGFRCLVAGDAEDALKTAREVGPDLLISGASTPRVDGVELCRRIRGDERLASLPVLLVSDHGKGAECADEGLRAGADDYVEFPCDPVLLAAKVGRLTERRRMEEGLRRSEERFNLVSRATNDAIWDWDFATGMLRFGEGVGSLYGYRNEGAEFDLSWWESRLHPDDREGVVARLESFIGGGGSQVWSDEYRFLCAGGAYAHVIDRGFLVRDAAGRPARMIGSMMDVTARKRAEEGLREADQRAIKEYERVLGRIAQLAQTLGAARDLTSVFEALRAFITASAPCDGVLVSFYDEARNVRVPGYGWLDGRELEVGGFEPIPVGDGFVGRAIKSEAVAVTGDYQRELVGHLIYHIDPAGGGHVPHSALVAPMTLKGRTVGTVEIQSYRRDAYQHEHETVMQMAANLAANAIENVRLLEQERVREEQLRQSQKMEAVGKLAGGVAHDFNNLLTAITGYSDLTLRRLPPGDPLRHNVEEIRRAGERAAGLTRQLLAFSRKQVLQPKVLDLNDVIRDAHKMLCRLIGEDIDVVLALKAGLWKARVDPGQVDQVLMNLASNARDAMPFGGRLEIRTANVEMDPEVAGRYASVQAGPHVLLAVSDTGHGMDEGTKERVFEPFFTTKEVGKGTGLGLSTVYGIVKQSGGYISVESEVGRGTSFKIYLPQVCEPEQEAGNEAPSAAPRGREVVLVAEDEEMVRSLTRTILERYGYTVLEAAGGRQALDLCRAHQGPIHLLLSDVVMPGMSGRALAERALELRPLLRVLYMSGYTDDAIVHHGVLEEDTPFLQKPFPPDALAHKVREVLDAPAPCGASGARNV